MRGRVAPAVAKIGHPTPLAGGFSWSAMRVQSLVGLCLAGWLAACTPTFNWRNVALEGAALQAQLPCKPERAERQVPLNASGAQLRLASCEAGGLTFALAWADVGTSDGLPAVLDRWQQAGWAALRLPAAADAPTGWTAWQAPLPRAQHLRGWQGTGTDHQGRAVSAWQLYFAQGTVVYQAAVYGPAIPSAQVAPFFEALQLPGSP